MSDQIISYVEGILKDAPISMPARLLGPDKKRLTPRLVYPDLRDMLTAFAGGKSANRYLIMPGLRGTGKSTLLAELYTHATTTLGIPTSDVLCIDAGEARLMLNASIAEVIKGYEAIVREPLNSGKTRIVLLDEAHYDPQWEITMKMVYERSPRVFIAVTGSSASALQANSDLRSDTIRRAQYERIAPLRFREYAALRHGVAPEDGLGTAIARALFTSGTAQDAHDALAELMPKIAAYWHAVPKFAIEQYLTIGSFPFTIDLPEPEAYRRTIERIRHVVSRDIDPATSLDKSELAKIPRLLLVLATMEDITHETILSNNLLDTNKVTLGKMLRACEDAAIIRIVPEIGAQKVMVRNTTPRYVFTASTIKAAYRWIMGRMNHAPESLGRLLEDAAMLAFDRAQHLGFVEAVGRRRSDAEADFVLRRPDGTLIACELGYGEKSAKQCEATIAALSCAYGMTVSEGSLEVRGNTVMVPKSVFLSI